MILVQTEKDREFFPLLYLDYRDGKEKAEDIYTSQYKNWESYKKKGLWLKENFSLEARKDLVESLLTYNKELNAGEKTLENIELLKDKETVCVVTGQQAGILTGPLYTFYKAVAAVKLAKKINVETGIKVVPVFWIAAEDHDFQEINHAAVIDKKGKLTELELKGEEKGLPVEYLSLDTEAVFELINELHEVLPSTEFKEKIIKSVRDAANDSKSITGWFGRLMALLFKDTGLIIFNPLLPGVRPGAASILAQICRSREEVNVNLKEREELLKEKGYHIQVKREENQLNLFAFLKGGRAGLLFQKGRVLTRQEEDIGSLEEVAAKMEKNPLNFGPNVLTRPLVQEVLLPTLAYIGGAGEISYFAQLMPLFPLFGLEPPVLYPRPSLTLVEPRFGRYMDKYSLTEEDIFRVRKALDNYLKEQGVKEVDILFDNLEDTIRGEYQNLKKELGSINNGLKGLCDTNLQRVLKEVAYLRSKGEQSLKEKHGVAVRHFRTMEESFLPMGQLQERVYNILPFIVKYGPDFIKQLLADFPMDSGHHIYRW